MLKVLISSPYKSNSGYGYKSRDFIRAFIKSYPNIDLKLFTMNWNSSTTNDIDDLDEYLVTRVESNLDVYIQIGLPSDMQYVGKKNILITAGTEVSKIPIGWVDYLNKCDLVIVPSKFTRDVILSNPNVTTRVEILFEGYDSNIIPTKFDLQEVDEDFCFLYVGQYMDNGVFSQDRKNLGNTLYHFFDTFKNKKKQPALILKTQTGDLSKIDYGIVMKFITGVKKMFSGVVLPNVYLIHGELSVEEMYGLYHNNKIKAMVSLTRGEGYGRPLLEFSTTGKPIVVSNHSGHLDFLNKSTNHLVKGNLINIHPCSVWSAMPSDSKWFEPDYNDYKKALNNVFTNYYVFNKKNDMTRFNLDCMMTKLQNIFKEILDVRK